MATVRKTIILTDRQDAWIKAELDRRGFTNDSEYIRDLIRREQEQSQFGDTLCGELIKGEKSGEPVSFDAAEFKARMRREHG